MDMTIIAAIVIATAGIAGMLILHAILNGATAAAAGAEDRAALAKVETDATLELVSRQAELLRKQQHEISDLHEDLAGLLRLIPAYGRDPKTGRFKKVRQQ